MIALRKTQQTGPAPGPEVLREASLEGRIAMILRFFRGYAEDCAQSQLWGMIRTKSG